MWKTSKWTLLITCIPILVGIGFIILGLMESPDTLMDDGISLQTFYYIMGAFFTIFPLLGLIGTFSYYKKVNDREKNLILKGIKGKAEILNREQTGTYINQLPQVKFQLQITLADREAYEVEHTTVVSLLDMNSINIGAKIPVFVDPDDEKNILLIYK